VLVARQVSFRNCRRSDRSPIHSGDHSRQIYLAQAGPGYSPVREGCSGATVRPIRVRRYFGRTTGGYSSVWKSLLTAGRDGPARSVSSVPNATIATVPRARAGVLVRSRSRGLRPGRAAFLTHVFTRSGSAARRRRARKPDE
jgi:hypothetical protein